MVVRACKIFLLLILINGIDVTFLVIKAPEEATHSSKT
jgi:hypothetical protein